MWTGVIMLIIAGFVLTIAIAMKVVAKVSDSRPVFYASVVGFLLLYILAVVILSRLNTNLPRANISSLSELFQVNQAEPEGVPSEESLLAE